MTLYVLDTDQISLFRFGHPVVTDRVLKTPASQLATTIITVEEQLSGWYTQIRRAKKVDQLERAYQGLQQVAELSRTIRILPFQRSALDRYASLRKQFPRLGKLDMAIAAITLEVGGVLVTRNRSDFQQVSGLALEDWTTESVPGN